MASNPWDPARNPNQTFSAALMILITDAPNQALHRVAKGKESPPELTPEDAERMLKVRGAARNSRNLTKKPCHDCGSYHEKLYEWFNERVCKLCRKKRSKVREIQRAFIFEKSLSKPIDEVEAIYLR